MDNNDFAESNATQLHQSRKEMYDSIDVYRKKHIDRKTGLIYSNLVENRLCPACSSNEPRLLFNKNGGSYVICGFCEMVYLNPVMTDVSLAKYYANNIDAQSQAHDDEDEFYIRLYSKGLSLVEKYSKKGRLLDIGCSGGLFLDVAKKKGWSTYGIELNKKEFEKAARKGHQVCNTSIEHLNEDFVFDAITMWDVFEHIKNGSNYLKTLKNILTEHGILFLQVPNVGSLAARVLQDKCNLFDGIEHVNLYSPFLIDKMLTSNGYAIKYIGTVIDELQILQKYLSYQDPYFGEEIKVNPIPFVDSEVIHNNCLGYKIQVIAQRCG